MTAAAHDGRCTHLPVSFVSLVQCARAVCDGVRVDAAAGRATVATDLFARLADLESITHIAEREIVATRAATS